MLLPDLPFAGEVDLALLSVPLLSDMAERWVSEEMGIMCGDNGAGEYSY